MLTLHRRLVLSSAEGVDAVCEYVFHLPDWPEGEDECVLEYASKTASGIAVSTIGAELAEAYYRRRQGGIMYFTGGRPGRVFVSLDARWCRWLSASSGLGVSP